MATRFYNKQGKTTLSNRGTAVRQMCEAVVSAKVKNPRGRTAHESLVAGAVTAGYTKWCKGHNAEPIGCFRFSQLVKTFLPLFLRGETGAFNLIDETDMSYTDACLFGSEAAKLMGVAEKNGVQVVFKKVHK